MESTRHNHQSATISLIEENGEWRFVFRLGDDYSEVYHFHPQMVNVGAPQPFDKQSLCLNNPMAEKKLAAPKRRTHAEVQQLVAEFTGSGMGRSEFCRSRGMGISTLVRYLKGQAKDSASLMSMWARYASTLVNLKKQALFWPSAKVPLRLPQPNCDLL